MPKEGVSTADDNISSTSKDKSATDGNGYSADLNVDEEEGSAELTAGDIKVAPAKKTIVVGEILNISMYPSGAISKRYDELPDEEWDELIEENIDAIIFALLKVQLLQLIHEVRLKVKRKGVQLLIQQLLIGMVQKIHIERKFM